MTQVKKPKHREAILAASFSYFSESDYQHTTIAQIARRAGLSTANVYNYFPSKVDILYSIYEPWLAVRLDRLEARIARMRSPRTKLCAILRTLWCEIPSEDNGFAHNFIQAIATIDASDGYRPELLRATLRRVQAMLAGAVPVKQHALLEGTRLADVIMMAFDGYVIVRHLNPDQKCDDRAISLFVDLLLPRAAPADRGRPAGSKARRRYADVSSAGRDTARYK
jgi:AcrR family transcriptional regulator